MNLKITVKYGGDGSTSQISDVPSSCTIGKLKKIVGQINKMEKTDSIRLIQNGTILQDDTKIESLHLNNQNSLRIYATGIPNKVHKSTSPNMNFRSPNQLNTPIQNNQQNKQAPILERIKNFANENRQGFFMGIGLIVVTLSLALSGIQKGTLNVPRKSFLRNPFTGILNGQFTVGNSLSLAFTVLLAIWILFIIKKIGIKEFFKYILLFFKSLLPFFDMNGFRAEHNLN